VHCPTQRYNAKQRLGRGFTVEEIKGAGLTVRYARTIGIAVDERRTNACEDSLQLNTERLKEYLSKLVLFPRRRLNQPKKGDSTAEECKAAVQFKGAQIMPLEKKKPEIVMAEVTQEMKDFQAHTAMKIAKKETKVAGYRKAAEIRKKE